MKKITLEEKIEVIKAYAEGNPIEYFSKFHNNWFDKIHNIWDLEEGKYRIKPTKATAKFNVGDNLVFKMDENKVGPVIYKVIGVKENFYDFYNISSYTRNEAEQDFINVRDVLWYFEIYDYVTKTWKLLTYRRFTISEADSEFGVQHDTLSWKPMYNLGFKLKEITNV